LKKDGTPVTVVPVASPQTLALIRPAPPPVREVTVNEPLPSLRMPNSAWS
jgi:hypothetical protein